METKGENSSSSSQSKHKGVKNIGNEDICRDEEKLIYKDEDMSSKTSTPKKDNTRIDKEDELESVKAEVGEMKEENERLKKMLERIENDYRSLQMRFFGILQHEKPPTTTTTSEFRPVKDETENKEEPETSLSLGFQSGIKRKMDDNDGISSKGRESAELMSEGLSLGLQFKCTPHIDLTDVGSERSNKIDDTKEDETEETWPPSKVLKKVESSEKEEESEQSNNPKRARVSVRARCETPTMNDGCQWRKYGQKIAKGNPCPRAYYRCTVAPACPVRKQVQRCSEDMSILITTYEGAHNHQLPVAATAMASTTSAAASILLSGSSTSQGPSSSTPITTTANLNGLNYTLYNNLKPGQLNLPNCSSPTPPTITLDLTANSSSQFTKRFSSNFTPSHKYSKSLDFSSSESTTFPTAWNNSSYLNYGSLTSNTNPTGSISFGKSPQEQISHPYTDRISQSVPSSSNSSQHYLTETLTKVLTSDPSFQSAVAAAISTMVGSSNNNAMNIGRISTDSLAQNLKRGDQVPGISINAFPQNSTVCVPNFLNRPTSTTPNSQAAGSFMLLQPPFPFSLSKTSSTPDLRDHLQ